MKTTIRSASFLLPLAALILTLMPGYRAAAATDATSWDEAVLFEGYGADLEWRPDAAALKPEAMPVVLTFTAPADGRCRMTLMLPDLSASSHGANLPTKVVLGVLSRPNARAPWSHALQAVALRRTRELSFPCRAGEEVRIYAFANMDRATGALPGLPVRLNLDLILLTPRVRPDAATPGGTDTASLDALLRERRLAKPSPPDETIRYYMNRFPSSEFRGTATFHGAVPLAPRNEVADRAGLVISYYTRRVTMGGTKSEGFACQLVVLSEKDWKTELTGGQELGFAPTREAAFAMACQKISALLR